MELEEEKLVGCSGWYYPEWKGVFYPEKLPKKDWLVYYSRHFNTVEVNNSFYRLPGLKMLESWREKTPDGFRFTLKGVRSVTHRQKLVDVDDLVEQFFNHAGVLEEKLACVLWQLPPGLHADQERLAAFCRLLPTGFKNVIEFRHSSWFTEKTLDILRNYGVAFCMLSSPNLPAMVGVTTDFAYLRFHGKAKEWYKYNYSREELAEWLEKLYQTGVKHWYVYFNNTFYANAVGNCRTFREMINAGAEPQ